MPTLLFLFFSMKSSVRKREKYIDYLIIDSL